MKNDQILSAENVIVFDDDSKIALREQYYNYYRDLYYYGLRLSGSPEITKDCIQDLFLQFWSNCDQLNHVISKKAYLLKCLRRRIFVSIGREKKLDTIKEDFNQPYQFINSSEDDYIKNESHSILERKLIIAKKELSMRQQEVLYLKFNQGYTNDTICDIMEIKYQSVRNLLSEAVKLLRSKLDSEVPFN